ncbi:RND multidrug efflux transporter [Candidatus Rhodobacter oscarellae]|uniref:RND multidrug efflux transporter n=1 Tax=Candidatus Rhodobacter oscarellae TaxID=1675527 RepID=A0A0J9E552_9RHOB|nr:efflux RND transporter permease subunit [Candidatus Rhodobacter lobularis]KMW57862.1 RND multidrug efflux transporter [Candidatus Rhodobacter lobularis]
MNGLVDWAGGRARMVIAFILLSLAAGVFSYTVLPKEGEPDIDIPALVVSLPFPGISAEDSEKLLVKPMETELADLDGLDKMTATAVEGYANIVLEFEFGWDKQATIAEVRDRMSKAEAEFPEGAEQYTIDEINFSEFPIIIVNLSGALPERTLLNVAKDLQDRLESLDPVLEAALTGQRDEMLEVVIDPLRLEAYNVTAGDLINVVVNNNQLIAAGEVDSASGAFSVKIPSSFDEPQDVYNLPVKVNGDSVVTLGDLADIRLTFEDRVGTARFNGEKTVALQVVKRKGFNIIDTSTLVQAEVEAERASWPIELQQAITVGTSNDQSITVGSMVSQLEGSVLTAIALVMIVVLAALGTRSALLVGFAIPTSFMLCFAFLAVMGVAISNIVMFGLILAVGMLVDGAIVVVEYADRRIREGSGPMTAYLEAAKRMFWPIVSSTATTLCAFLPMLFWPGVPGEFMGMLPVTLIFVLSASLIVALIYLPVMGGVAGRMSRAFENASQWLRRSCSWVVRALLVPISWAVMYVGAIALLRGATMSEMLVAALIFLTGAILASITLGSVKIEREAKTIKSGYRRKPFGYFIKFIAGNPIMPVVSIIGVGFVVVATFSLFSENNYGVEFFVSTEPEQGIVFVQARGNLSIAEKDALVNQAEQAILGITGIDNAFAFAGAGGLNANTGGASGPLDTIGQIQLELVRWEDRPRVVQQTRLLGLIPFEVEEIDPEYSGNFVLEQIQAQLDQIPGIQTEILNLGVGPASAKPVHLRLKGDDWGDLRAAADIARARFDATPGLVDVEDSTPLPGIDWEINVDVEKAGRYGADVAIVGGMVQLVTRGLLLDTYTPINSDDEIEIRVRLPEQDRVLATLDTLKVRTDDGLIPMSNFISRKPVAKFGNISRIGQKRFYDVKAGVGDNLVKAVYDTEADADGNSDTVAVAVLEQLTDEQIDAGETGNYEIVGNEGQFRLVTETASAPNGAELRTVVINPNERIEVLTAWLEAEESPLPASIEYEWTGDAEDEAESQAFLGRAFIGALGLMFIILLAQFNSFYNSVLVLLAVVLSTTGVLIGMMVMQQPFSIIMTGTGIVALAGIVVNNNIVLIDTYQEYSKYMPRIEAIIRTAEVRIRPVLLTTITTMAGLAPMMFGLSVDFIGGGYSIDSPTALWWKSLATAVVFGLGVATVLTLIFTPSMLALRVWFGAAAYGAVRTGTRLVMPKSSRIGQDHALGREAKRVNSPELIWGFGEAINASEAGPVGEEFLEDEPALAGDSNAEDESDEALLKRLAMRAAE